MIKLKLNITCFKDSKWNNFFFKITGEGNSPVGFASGEALVKLIESNGVTKLLKYNLWRKGLLNGIAATIELENMVKDINPETIIDIGSNKGQFIMLIEQLFSNKIIYSFEPLVEALEIQKRFFNYKKNIFFYNFALGSNPSTKEFFITKRMDSSSFFKINKIKNKNYEIQSKKNIQIFTLDEVMVNKEIPKPILLKIDVQGYELEVLKGSDKILSKIDYLLIEVTDSEMYINQPISTEIIEYLKNKNFHIIKENVHLKIDNTNIVQKDLLFKKK